MKEMQHGMTAQRSFRPKGVPKIDIAAAVAAASEELDADDGSDDGLTMSSPGSNGAVGWHITDGPPAAWHIVDGPSTAADAGGESSSDAVVAQQDEDVHERRAEGPPGAREAGSRQGGVGALGASTRFRRPGCSSVLCWVLLVWIAFSLVELFRALSPELCDVSEETPARGRHRCILPLFGPDVRVDVFLFVSPEPSLLTGTIRGTHSPVWNATNLSLSDKTALWRGWGDGGGQWRAHVPVPASVWKGNGSLYAHIAVVRSGKSPFSSEHAPLAASGGGAAFPDLVMVATPLTRHAKVSRLHNKSMLLPSLSPDRRDGEEPGGGDGGVVLGVRGGGPATGAASAETGMKHGGGVGEDGELAAVRERDLMQLIAVLVLAFVLLGVVKPAPAAAALRVALLAVAAALAAGVHSRLRATRGQQSAARASIAEEAVALLRDDRRPVTHWKPLLKLRYVADSAAYPSGGRPPVLHHVWSPQLGGLLEAYYPVVALGERLRYVPRVDADDFWPSARLLSPLHEGGVDASRVLPDGSLALPLMLGLDVMPLWQYQGWMYLEQVFRMMHDVGFAERDLDDVKELLSQSSLKVLALTYAVVALHVLFDFLAFKEDIGFFLGRENYVGLSSRSLIASFVCFLVQFLYLLDNEYTSRIVPVSVPATAKRACCNTPRAHAVSRLECML